MIKSSIGTSNQKLIDNFFEADVGAHDAAGQPDQEDEDVFDSPTNKYKLLIGVLGVLERERERENSRRIQDTVGRPD